MGSVRISQVLLLGLLATGVFAGGGTGWLGWAKAKTVAVAHDPGKYLARSSGYRFLTYQEIPDLVMGRQKISTHLTLGSDRSPRPLRFEAGDVVQFLLRSGSWSANRETLPATDLAGYLQPEAYQNWVEIREEPTLPLGRLIAWIQPGGYMDAGAGRPLLIERGGDAQIKWNGSGEALPKASGQVEVEVQIYRESRREVPKVARRPTTFAPRPPPVESSSPEAGRSRILDERNEDGLHILRRSATRNRYWQTLPLDSTDHPEIVQYRIRWYNGKWSPWYYPGKEDIDWKVATRRVWCYFDDHEHEFAVKASEKN
jgi:hypothetical protein